jgi:hypothetical protein
VIDANPQIPLHSDEGVAKGIFLKTNPVIFHIMIIGAGLFYQASVPIRSKVKLNAKKTRDVAEEMENLILRAIKR